MSSPLHPRRRRLSRSLLPILLIGGGAVLLMNTSGLASTAVWRLAAQLWPVLLIVIGVRMVRRQHVPPVALFLALSIACWVGGHRC